MKRVKLLLILVICLSLFSQTNIIIKNSWLQTGSYSLHNSQKMQDAISTLTLDPINLDISYCLTNMQSEGISNQPIFGVDNSQPSGTDWMLDYHTTFTYYGLNRVLNPNEYGATVSNPGGDSYTGLYSQVSIVLNSNAGSSWNSDGNVDINTVLRHEIGHLYGLDDYEEWGTFTLMNPLEKDSVNYLDQNSINGLRIIFDEPTTTIDGNSIIESGEGFSYNINFPVIEYGPDFGDIPDGFGFHSYLYKDDVLQSPDPIIPTHIETYEDGTQLFTNSLGTTDLALGEYSIRTYSAMFWNPDAYSSWYENYNRPYSEVSFMVVPKIIKPLLEDIYFLPPSSEKGAIADTIEVKVQVPEILGSYQAIKLKIDDVYVDQGDILFEDNLWVYYWDLSDVTSEITGKKFKIEAELFDDPSCKNESGVMIVEALYYEDFEAFTGVGWEVYFYENPNIPYNGWFLNTDPLDAENTCLTTLTQNSMSLQYQIWSQAFIVPDSSDFETILDYSVYFDKTDENNQSNLYFWVTDENENLLTNRERLYPVDGEWTHFNHDLSEFYGQTIKFRWENNYWSSTVPCDTTTYALDSILVYVTPPDMDQPVIDYITGNQANVDEDMNINLTFNDASGIVSVTADYNIEGESGTITLSSAKNSYNYTGIISARDHVCDGDIKFRVEDEIGNTIISDRYSISWTDVIQVPTTPSNLLITAENDSTIALTWSIVAGASEYKVYASEDPYGTFILDTLGTFISGTHWQKNIGTNKMFYRITAGNASKMFVPKNNTKSEKVDVEKNLIFIDPKKRRK
ncbi:MAG: hypothetical protein PF638_14120 [Candidatus Delongbacteria bacterium]|jgi:hypothetical protein|nr:hypothetical protein [Candidatus Delongbacteria bacterium]